MSPHSLFIESFSFCLSIERRKAAKTLLAWVSRGRTACGCVAVAYEAWMVDLLHVQCQNGQILTNFDPVERRCCHLSPPFINLYYSHLNYFHTRACWGTLVSLIMMKINFQSPPPFFFSRACARAQTQMGLELEVAQPSAFIAFLSINQCYAVHLLSQID